MPTSRFSEPTRLERMYHHILEASIDRGIPFAEARRIAAATVNKYRSARVARGEGPSLVTAGGSRRQWYPGKERALGKPERFYCLKHHREFKTKAGLLAHYRSH